MCGISGIVNLENHGFVNKELLEDITCTLSHRGPDDKGFYISDDRHVGLGHTRLSIIDLDGGHQPMTNSRKTSWIVFNGEIYNYLELKSELRKKGYDFHSNSDTEVILNFYEEYGTEKFYRLKGIFAFAIYNTVKNIVILARDHFGVKPLYYYYKDGIFLFGSEIKSILKYPALKRELDMQSFNTFLTFRYNPAPQTLFKNIKKLKAGHYLSISKNGITHNSFFQKKLTTNFSLSFENAVEQYSELLEGAVKRQMISDVPVGLLLSGGIDSAVIGRIMTEYSHYRIKSFSIGFEGVGDYNELGDARVSSRLIGSDHYEITLTKEEYLKYYFNSFDSIEEPIAETTIPALYYVSRLASQYVKVVLAGQGADEPLAGYRRYFGENMISKYYKLLHVLPLNIISAILTRNERFKQAVYALRFQNELERFLAIYTIFTPSQKLQILNPDIKDNLENFDIELIRNYYNQAENLSGSLAKILFIDARMHLSDNLLLFGDKMSMANAIEMRVPFLDIELMNFLETLPSEYKLKINTHKLIHRKALKKWLPDEIIQRKKRPFATPMDEWLQSDFVEDVIDILNADDSSARLFFNLNEINKMIDDHKNRKQNYRKQLFAILSFELWYKNYFK